MYQNPPIEEFYGYLPDEDDVLAHYGIKRRSGRYPWGSGENPYQRTGDLISRYYELADKGLSEREIAAEMKTTTTKLRVQMAYAKNQRRMLDVERAKSLRADGKSLNEIAAIMGFKNDSSVRSLLNENAETRMKQSMKTAEELKKLVDEKGFLDVGPGVEHELGVSRTKFEQALYILELEGYDTMNRRLPQATNPNQKTTLKVLTPPGTEYSEIYDTSKINSVTDYTISYDDGETFHKPFEFPESLDSKRLDIVYGDKGGKLKDGVIELRRGCADLDLGGSNYAQVRILVDGDKYLKGMAVYSDDLPKGVDVRFNTNKDTGTPLAKVLKPVKMTKDENGNEVIDRNNPFGSLIKEKGGQYYYKDKDGKEHLGLLNKRADEGDWDEWGKKLPSQFLAKQSVDLIHRQLNLSKAEAQAEYDEISSLENVTIRRKLLMDFANSCDKAAVTLKAAALPRQRYQVILPLTDIKDTEVYAPNYKDGEKVALIRYPHGGTFEIPILTVNNRLTEGKKVIGSDARDAVGINAKVAERLSGADFDGDTVMVIPAGGKTKIVSTKPLEGLVGFDPKVDYKIPDGNPNHVKLMTKANTQKQMGVVSNLIMDMTLRGATEQELARAVRHSMVVIDAEKHKLDYKQSEKDNGIAELKNKYQGHYDENGQYHEGAATLITRAKSDATVPKRRGSGYVNIKGKDGYDASRPEGAMIYRNALDKDLYYETSRVNHKTGEVVNKKQMRTQKSTKMAETDDAYTLVSTARTQQELAYADYANSMKALANSARKQMATAGRLHYDPQAKAKYATEVTELNAALRMAESNKPRERRAQALVNVRVKEKISKDPDLAEDKKMLRKVNQQELARARAEVGAKRNPITITDRQWEAIQAGAITDNTLSKILENTDMDKLRDRATPKASKTISSAKVARIKAYSASGYTNAQIAEMLGISSSTVGKYLKGKE